MTQAVVAGTEAEKADLEVLGLTNVRVLGAPPVSTTLSPGFGERSGILLVLPVLPVAMRFMTVCTGSSTKSFQSWTGVCRRTQPSSLRAIRPPGSISAFARYRRLEAFPEDADLAALYRSRRILVEPTRVLPAIPREVLDAAAAGLPAVLSETVCKTLGWENGKDCLSGGFCNPEQFAQAVIGLYTDMDLWNTISRGAQARMEEEASRSNFHDGLREILSIAAGTTPLAASTVTPRAHRLSETAPGLLPRRSVSSRADLRPKAIERPALRSDFG